jgi:hypothetical protein
MKSAYVTWKTRIGTFARLSLALTRNDYKIENSVSLKLVLLLLIIGGVELNPGPFPEPRPGCPSEKPSWIDSVLELATRRIINSIRPRLAQIENNITSNTTEINNLKTQIMELQQMGNENPTNHQTYEELIEKHERLRRGNNIIIMGLTEVNAETDVNTVKEIFETLVPNNNIQPAHIGRFGNSENMRPIRIALPDRNTKCLLLQKRPMLSDNEKYKNIAIKNDLTKIQLQINRERRSKQSSENTNYETNRETTDKNSSSIVSASASADSSQNTGQITSLGIKRRYQPGRVAVYKQKTVKRKKPRSDPGTKNQEPASVTLINTARLKVNPIQTPTINEELLT